MSKSSTLLHPASGAAILALDWLFFSGSVVSMGLSTPILIVLGIGSGTFLTGLIQRRYGGDGWAASALKGLLGGVAVGIPLPIAGTAVGGAILALSGLNNWSLLSGSGTRPEDRSSEDE